jgi:hypothetical protein
MTADEFDMSKEIVRNILIKDLGMRELTVKLVLSNLMEEQKDRCLLLCMDFGEQLQTDNFFNCVITGDETWGYQYDPKVKHQSMD